MKILIITFLYSFLFGNDGFVDLKGDKVEINNKQKNIIIVCSSVSCHNCYLQLADFFKKNNVYNDTSINLTVIVNISKDNIQNIVYKKTLSNNVKELFPQINNIIFNCKTKGSYYYLFKKKIDERLLPNVFLISNGQKKYFAIDNIFDYSNDISKSFNDCIINLKNK